MGICRSCDTDASGADPNADADDEADDDGEAAAGDAADEAARVEEEDSSCLS